MDRRRVPIAHRTKRGRAALVLVVAAPVVEHVGERVAHLPRARDRGRMIAIREDAPRAAEHAGERARRHDRERPHAVAERGPVVRLDQEVQMIALDRRVDDAKRRLTKCALQRAPDRLVGLAAPHPGTVPAGAKQDVLDVVLANARTRAMRRIAALLEARANSVQRAWCAVTLWATRARLPLLCISDRLFTHV